MTKMINIKRIALFLVSILFIGYGNTAFASAISPKTIAYVEADGKFVNLDGADPNSIAGRFVQSSVENGYIWVFTTVNNKNVNSALKMIEKELKVNDKEIKNIKDVDENILNTAANYLQSDQLSITRIEIEEKSKETADQKWQRYLGYAAGVAAIVSIFKK